MGEPFEPLSARLVEPVGVEVEDRVPNLADGVKLVDESAPIELELDPAPVRGLADELLVGPEGEVGGPDVTAHSPRRRRLLCSGPHGAQST